MLVDSAFSHLMGKILLERDTLNMKERLDLFIMLRSALDEEVLKLARLALAGAKGEDYPTS